MEKLQATILSESSVKIAVLAWYVLWNILYELAYNIKFWINHLANTTNVLVKLKEIDFI